MGSPILGKFCIFLFFIGTFSAILIIFLPLIGRQSLNLVEKIPAMVDQSQGLLFLLSEKFPKIFSFPSPLLQSKIE